MAMSVDVGFGKLGDFLNENLKLEYNRLEVGEGIGANPTTGDISVTSELNEVDVTSKVNEVTIKT